jgi:hypothetical protein
MSQNDTAELAQARHLETKAMGALVVAFLHGVVACSQHDDSIMWEKLLHGISTAWFSCSPPASLFFCCSTHFQAWEWIIVCF